MSKYAVSIQAMKEMGSVVTVVHKALVYEHPGEPVSEDVLSEVLLDLCKSRFPSADGWHSNDASWVLIPEEAQ